MTFTNKLNLLIACGLALFAQSEATHAREFQQNVAFTTKKQDPYGPGKSFEISEPGRTILSKPLLLNAGPAIKVDAWDAVLGGLLPSDLLPNIFSLEAGFGLHGSNNLDFGYYVRGGRLDITYPATSKLNIATDANDTIVANEIYHIGGQFLPGVSQRTIPSEFWTTLGPGGPELFITREVTGEGGFKVRTGPQPPSVTQPSFIVHSPYASAWLDSRVDVRVGAYAKVEALGGLIDEGVDFTFGTSIGNRIAEIDPSGLYIGGVKMSDVDLNNPVPLHVPLNGASADLRLPVLGLASNSQQGRVIRGFEQSPILTVNGDLEKFVPAIGPLLKGSIGPFGYKLLSVTGGPVVSLYQQMSFDPNPQVRLQFSEPVLVQGMQDGLTVKAGPGDYLPTTVATMSVDGGSLNWQPMFSDSSTITVAPIYRLDNKFTTEVGFDFSVAGRVQALEVTHPFGTVGPLIDEEFSASLIKQKLLTNEFTVPIGEVIAERQTFKKLNINLLSGESLRLADFFVKSSDPQGHYTFDLLFERTLAAGGTQAYRADGVTGLLTTRSTGLPDDPETERDESIYSTFKADADIRPRDPLSGDELNIGPYWVTGAPDLSALMPTVSHSYVDPDPLVGALFANDIPALANTDVDLPNDVKLRGYNGLEFAPAPFVETNPPVVIDRRVGGFSNVIARTGDFTPEFDGKFTALPLHSLSVDRNGNVLFSGAAISSGATTSFKAMYRSDGKRAVELLHEGDTAPDGNGVVDFGEIVQYQANEIGQFAFDNTSGVFRYGPGGFKRLVQVGAAAPGGNGQFTQLDAAAINEGGQVAVYAQVLADAPINPLNPNEHGVYRVDGTSSVKIARDGDALPGITTRSRIISEPAISGSGTVLFGADGRNASNLGVVGLFVGDGGAATKVVTSDDVSPSGLRYQNGFYDYEINNSNQVAFVAALENAPPSDPPLGVYRWDNGHVDEIAVENTTPRQDGTPMFGIGGLQLNNAGDVAFTERRGVYLYQDDELQGLAYNGLPLADGSGTVEPEGFGLPILNERGQVAFDAGVFITSEQAFHDSIFVHDGERLVEVARSGQALAGSVVQNLYVADMNDRMQVVYYAELADSRQVVVRFDPALYWKAPGSGQWETDGNWSLGVDPAASYDANIIAAQPLTVMGPAVDSAVRSLVLGGEQTAEAVLDLVDGTTLTIAEGARVRASGVLRGKGTIDGDVVNEGGTVSPGASPGTLHIDGDYLQGPLGKLALEIAGPNAGTEYDVLDVSGDVLLAGEVEIALVAGYIPAPGTRFSLVAYDGTFDASQAEFRVTGAPAGTQFSAFAANGVFGIVAGVPEPSGLALACLSCAAAIGRWRRG